MKIERIPEIFEIIFVLGDFWTGLVYKLSWKFKNTYIFKMLLFCLFFSDHWL